ncbi:MAG: VCBS repeat-containing protein, partial [Cenarchaeum sp. SB0669_bin_11]|nr:VCBS repeat-containing protein [Cenarchaeum sp. SB0669_bin_11]
MMMLQPRQSLSMGEPVKLHDKQGARATSYSTSRLFLYVVCAATLLLSFNAALGAGEAGLGDAYVSDDVYPTAAIEINGLTPNGPVLANNAFFGISVASLGDLDGNGVPDLAVGAEFDNASGTYRGTVHVILMNGDGTVKSTSEINGATYSNFGTSVASMGDFDGDGVPDLAVG